MDDTLRKLQLTELEILKVIDGICKKHDIKYSLYAGTLLGAVRHKGFIPWDDDLDICMSREQYNRFLEVWSSESPKGYLLQNKDNIPTFTQSFSKIRKDNTTFFQDGEIAGDYHMGIFVDIFPIDRMPNGKLKRYTFVWRCMKYQLFCREFVPTQNGGIAKIASEIILKTTPNNLRKKKRQRLIKKITKYNSEKRNNTVAIEIKRTFSTPLPPDLMDEYVTLEFEGNEFPCVKKWDEYLTIKFGDYMKFPPEAERTWAHPPIIIDFEHNYEDINQN